MTFALFKYHCTVNNLTMAGKSHQSLSCNYQTKYSKPRHILSNLNFFVTQFLFYDHNNQISNAVLIILQMTSAIYKMAIPYHCNTILLLCFMSENVYFHGKPKMYDCKFSTDTPQTS